MSRVSASGRPILQQPALGPRAHQEPLMSVGQLGNPASMDAPAPSITVNCCVDAASVINRSRGGCAKASKLIDASSSAARRRETLVRWAHSRRLRTQRHSVQGPARPRIASRCSPMVAAALRRFPRRASAVPGWVDHHAAAATGISRRGAQQGRRRERPPFTGGEIDFLAGRSPRPRLARNRGTDWVRRPPGP